MLRDEKDAGDQWIARRFLADTRNRGLILEHVKFFYLESIHWRLLRIAATLEFGGRGWAVTDLFARIDAARFGRGQVKGVEQIIGRCQHLINRENFRKARGYSANLDVETRVLRVEHVEQRTAADRKLLAIGQQIGREHV